MKKKTEEVLVASKVRKTRESAVKIEERGSYLGILKLDQVMQECSRANAASSLMLKNKEIF